MRCPFCQSLNVSVADTRSRDDGTIIWRRRLCLSCGGRFSSREKIDFSYLTVVKRSGKKETLSREKIVQAILKSTGKKALSEDQIGRLADEILQEIHKLGKRHIKSSEIGSLILAKLKKADPVAYIRFASVFKDVRDTKDFKKVLEGID